MDECSNSNYSLDRDLIRPITDILLIFISHSQLFHIRFPHKSLYSRFKLECRLWNSDFFFLLQVALNVEIMWKRKVFSYFY